MGSETLLFSKIPKHASHFKMDSNTHTHTHNHTQTHIVYYYYYYYYHHYVFPLLNPSQLPIEISYFNRNKAFPDPCSYNIISSSKCEECVLKFVPHLFVTPCILCKWNRESHYLVLMYFIIFLEFNDWPPNTTFMEFIVLLLQG